MDIEVTSISASNIREPARGFGNRITTLLVSHWERLRRKYAIKHTRRTLEELPDSILRDIGISRGEIYHLSKLVHQPMREDDDRSWRFLS